MPQPAFSGLSVRHPLDYDNYTVIRTCMCLKAGKESWVSEERRLCFLVAARGSERELNFLLPGALFRDEGGAATDTVGWTNRPAHCGQATSLSPRLLETGQCANCADRFALVQPSDLLSEALETKLWQGLPC